jgi:hypothetical protein
LDALPIVAAIRTYGKLTIEKPKGGEDTRAEVGQAWSQAWRKRWLQ